MAENRVCTCEWTEYMPPIKTLSGRDPECEVHGDGTPLWTKIQKRAAELVEKYNIPRACDKDEA